MEKNSQWRRWGFFFSGFTVGELQFWPPKMASEEWPPNPTAPKRIDYLLAYSAGPIYVSILSPPQNSLQKSFNTFNTFSCRRFTSL